MNIKDLYLQSYIGNKGLARKEAVDFLQVAALSPIINGVLRGYLANRNKDDNDKHYVGETTKGALAGSLGPVLGIGSAWGFDSLTQPLYDQLEKRAHNLWEHTSRNRDNARIRIKAPVTNFERKYHKEYLIDKDITRKWKELLDKRERELKTLDDSTRQRRDRIFTLLNKGRTNLNRKVGRISTIIGTAGLTLPLLYSLSPLLQKDKPKTISEKIKGLFK